MPALKIRGAVFLSIFLILAGYSSLRSQQEESEPVILKPIKTVFPKYPDHLKKEGIAGEVIIGALIDEQGNVKPREPLHIIRSLHPELDRLATEAIKQWKYAPPLFRGKQRGALTYISVIFDPGELTEEAESALREPMSEELLGALDRSWEYCRKVEDIARFYLCRERIVETVKAIVNVGRSILGSTEIEGEFIKFRVGSFVPDLANPETTRYINDYQVTNLNNRVTELRTLVKPPPSERDSLFGKKPLLFSIPISLPTRLLAPGFRGEYIYSFGGEDRALGKDCRVIEVAARKRRGVEVQKAALWIERNSGRVVQAEIESDPSSIDDRILAECRKYYIAPRLKAIFQYDEDKKGILFPSRSEIVLEYSQLGQRNTRDTKMKLDIRYDQYRFFTVESEPKIIRAEQ